VVKRQGGEVMSLFEHLYDDSEQAKVRFVGFVSDSQRYDFGIIYTTRFFGKPLVVCMQTGRSSLMCAEDVVNTDYLKQVFNLVDLDEAEKLKEFFKLNLPSVFMEDQY
jgi:cytochrome c-type biogenesis protein CcmE